MAKWFGAHYNQEVRISSAVKCKKGPQVLTSRQRLEEFIIIISIPHEKILRNSPFETIEEFRDEDIALGQHFHVKTCD